MGTELVWRHELESGTIAWVVTREEPMTDENRVALANYKQVGLAAKHHRPDVEWEMIDARAVMTGRTSEGAG